MTAMDPTTLVTFIFRAPPEIRTVELLGSWDNFKQPYRMHHDRRRGNGFWSGCFKFENIVFDGHGLEYTKPRSGGLKQGGTYWYYYRLNYDLEAWDDRQPQTTGCPLLPGQRLNIIDVPLEMVPPPTRAHSSYGDIAGSLAHLAEKQVHQRQSLDPGDKFAALEPPAKSKVHARCLSDEALDGRLERIQSTPLIVVHDSISPLSSAHSHRPPPASADSKISRTSDKGLGSRTSSVYSQEDRASVPATVHSEAEDKAQPREEPETYELPAFPYPNVLGPAPLGSLEAFGATLFTNSEGAETVGFNEEDESDYEPAPRRSRRPSESSIGPCSVQNVQFYGSRPGTNLTQDPGQYRPRMYSLPNVEICIDDDPPPVPGLPSSFCSRRASEEMDNGLTPDWDDGTFDLISPTFSAATISTHGQNTPFRLSAQNSSSGSAHIPLDTFDEASDLGGITERLRALSASQDQAAPDSFESRSFERRLSPSFINYSLPNLASESTHSLTKTASHPSVPMSADEEVPPLPAIFSEGQGRSMAEEIFSEMGF